MKKYFSRHHLITIVLFGLGTICFFFGGKALLTHESFITSWWLLDWLIFALPAQFFISLLSISKLKTSTIQYFFGVMSISLLFMMLLSGGLGTRSLFLAVGRGGTGWLLYHAKNQRLLSRRYRTIWGYLGSQVFLWGSCLGLLTTASLLSNISDRGINCNQLERSLRLSGLQEKMDIMSLGGFLGVNNLTENEVASFGSGGTAGSGDTEQGVPQGLLGMLSLAKSQIYDLVVEQQDLLNHSLCGLINEQLLTIQHRPWRQIAGILLLYIFIRPLVGILVRLSLPIQIFVRKILVRTNLIKKQEQKVTIVGAVLD